MLLRPRSASLRSLAAVLSLFGLIGTFAACGDDTGGGSGGGSSEGCTSASECPEVQCEGEDFPSRTCSNGVCRTEDDCGGGW